jgi:hypothetical protein
MLAQSFWLTRNDVDLLGACLHHDFSGMAKAYVDAHSPAEIAIDMRAGTPQGYLHGYARLA